ncbi:unnamed protein product [Boreogadus saida]
MRNNISGLEEDEEDSTITEQKPSWKTLKMPAADLAMVDFQRAHRFGIVTLNKPGTIIAGGRLCGAAADQLSRGYFHPSLLGQWLCGASAIILPATQQLPTSAECSLPSSADLTITLSSQTALRLRTAPCLMTSSTASSITVRLHDH